MSAAEHMSICDDVSVRVDDYSGAKTLLSSKYKIGVASTAFHRAITRHQHLDNARRNALDECPYGVVELVKWIQLRLGGNCLC